MRGAAVDAAGGSSVPNLLTLGPVASRFLSTRPKKKDGKHMSAKVVGPRDGKAGSSGASASGS